MHECKVLSVVCSQATNELSEKLTSVEQGTARISDMAKVGDATGSEASVARSIIGEEMCNGEGSSIRDCLTSVFENGADGVSNDDPSAAGGVVALSVGKRLTFGIKDISGTPNGAGICPGFNHLGCWVVDIV